MLKDETGAQLKAPEIQWDQSCEAGEDNDGYWYGHEVRGEDRKLNRYTTLGNSLF